MQTIAEVVDSSQEVLLQAFQKQAPRRGISAVGASSPPPVARIRDLRGITAMGTLALLLLHAREPNIFPGMTTLAADMKKSVCTARRAVRELVQAGYLRVTPRIGQTNLYSITVAGATSRPRIHALPPVSVTPPPYHPCNPTPITHDTPPLSPVTPEVAIEVSNISIKRERESKRTLSPGNHIPQETITCPACERSWPASWGTVCNKCHMEIETIQRNIDERKRQHEAFLAELRKEQDAEAKQLESYRQKREAQRKAQLAAETRTQEQKAKQQEESPVEVGTEKEFMKDQRQKLMDILDKPFNPKVGKRFEFAMGGD